MLRSIWHLGALAALLVLTHPATAVAQPAPTEAAPAPAELTVADVGFAARYWEPATGPRKAPVLVLPGSNGGYPSARVGRSLAAAGHPVVGLAYFSAAPAIPGLPTRLREIPLEYVDRAIGWLAAKSGRPVVLMGESRGAELALLLGSRRPKLAGVIAFAPTTAVWRAPPAEANEKPAAAWTEKGKGVAWLSDDDAPGLTSNQRFDRALARGKGAARIPVERIKAPLLLIAGGDDRIWSSTPAARSIQAKVPNATVLHYPDAGHLLMGPGAGVSRFEAPGFVVEFGGTDATNLAAREDAWAKTLAFLEKVSAR
ncbi:acyl-CoA thioester hydrolase/BAAT C-terminal domain-containing protein [Sphingoaurantiacus capsulatus]|uniref:Acyl-CoA thioester hydrolase/BAAT C-terminal domain-containing protein n=1 Tax=Sphingoaurantiacus capsulatus TaxID=1771310 RepID=A0ABV7XEF9_9SPHN